jgi:hypothetical protein
MVCHLSWQMILSEPAIPKGTHLTLPAIPCPPPRPLYARQCMSNTGTASTTPPSLHKRCNSVNIQRQQLCL